MSHVTFAVWVASAKTEYVACFVFFLLLLVWASKGFILHNQALCKPTGTGCTTRIKTSMVTFSVISWTSCKKTVRSKFEDVVTSPKILWPVTWVTCSAMSINQLDWLWCKSATCTILNELPFKGTAKPKLKFEKQITRLSHLRLWSFSWLFQYLSQRDPIKIRCMHKNVDRVSGSLSGLSKRSTSAPYY